MLHVMTKDYAILIVSINLLILDIANLKDLF